MWYSKAALGYRNGLRGRVLGEKGSAEWLQTNPEELIEVNMYGDRFVLDKASSDIFLANQERYNRFKVGHPAGFIEEFSNHNCDIFQRFRKYKI